MDRVLPWVTNGNFTALNPQCLPCLHLGTVQSNIQLDHFEGNFLKDLLHCLVTVCLDGKYLRVCSLIFRLRFMFVKKVVHERLKLEFQFSRSIYPIWSWRIGNIANLWFKARIYSHHESLMILSARFSWE